MNSGVCDSGDDDDNLSGCGAASDGALLTQECASSPASTTAAVATGTASRTPTGGEARVPGISPRAAKRKSPPSAYGNSGGSSDDDCESDDSDDTSDDDEDEEEDEGPKMTMLEIRAMKVKRNQELLERLGLASGFSGSSGARGGSGGGKKAGRDDVDAEEKDDSSVDEENEPRQARGMLLTTPLIGQSGDLGAEGIEERVGVFPQGFDVNRRLDELYDKYPFRESQLRQLLGVLAPIDPPPQETTAVAPAPILISGPSGTGKTAIVQDLLRLLAERQGPSSTATAYVNCATLDSPSSIEELTSVAYKQFEMQILHKSEAIASRQPRRAGRTKKRKARKTGAVAVASSLMVESAPREVDGGTNSADEGDERLDDTYSRSHLARSAAPAAETNRERRSKRSATDDVNRVSYSTSMGSLTASYRFGRSMKALFQTNAKASGVLVLDQADRLLSFLSSRGQGDTSCNLLGQLFLVPRTLGINLTIVAITNSYLLEHSRAY